MKYRELLTPYGFEVLTAPDGERACTIVEENPDILLVILDIAMPKMDGRQWLRWYRDSKNESPVIVITGYKIDPAELDLRPAVILEKPFHPAEFLDVVGLFCGLGTPLAPARTT
jgi:DNA-binding response OmpR family regulator